MGMMDFLKGGEKEDKLTQPAGSIDTEKEVKPFKPNVIPFQDEILAEINLKFEKAEKDRHLLELKWRLSTAYLDGNQYASLNSELKDIVEQDQLYWWQEREVFNQLQPIFETRLAKLAKLNVLMNVRPAQGDEDSLSKARMSKKILESFERESDFKKKQKTANVWSEKIGTAVWVGRWEKNAGKILGYKNVIPKQYPDEEVPQYLMQEAFEQNMRKPIFEGDVVWEVESPYEFFVDNIFASDISECRYVIRKRIMDVNLIEEQWGERVKGSLNNVTKLVSLGSIGGIDLKTENYTVASIGVENTAEVKEYWERATYRYPEGRHVIITGDKVLHAGPLDTKVGQYGQSDIPIVFQKSLDYGMAFGETILTRLIPVQRRYNAIKNRKQEYMNRITIGQKQYEEGTIDEDYIEEYGLAPGALIPYMRGSQGLMPVQQDELPQSLMQDEGMTEAMLYSMSGTSEISRNSSAPTGVGSGVALSILQEQDDTRKGLTADSMYDARIAIAKITLRLMKQHVKQPRLTRFVGKNNYIDTFTWLGSDLETSDIFIDSSSLLTYTPSQRQQMVFDLMDRGMFIDPELGKPTKETQGKIFELLEFGNWEDFDDGYSPQKKRAIRENNRMAQGVEAQWKPYDNDDVHINEHNDFRLTSQFEDLIKEQPNIESVFERHISAHMESLQKQMQQQKADILSQQSQMEQQQEQVMQAQSQGAVQ